MNVDNSTLSRGSRIYSHLLDDYLKCPEQGWCKRQETDEWVLGVGKFPDREWWSMEYWVLVGLNESVLGPALGCIRLIFCLWCPHPIWVPVWAPTVLLLLQLPVDDLGKQGRILQVLGILQWHGRPEKTPDTWLQIGPAPALEVTWEVNQQIEDPPCCLLLFEFQIK